MAIPELTPEEQECGWKVANGLKYRTVEYDSFVVERLINSPDFIPGRCDELKISMDKWSDDEGVIYVESIQLINLLRGIEVLYPEIVEKFKKDEL